MTPCPRTSSFTPGYPFDLRAPGAIDALLAYHRSWAGGHTMEDGFPENTPVVEMTPEQQAAYWRHHSQKHETRFKGLSSAIGGRTADQLKADLEELETHRAGSRTQAEQAVEDAKRTVRAEVLGEVGGKLVAAEFKAALAHVEEDRRAQIISGLNLASYLTDSGDVDTDKVKSFATALAPVATTNPPRPRDFGGGYRGDSGGPRERGAAGKAEASRRFKKNTDA